MKKQFKTLIHNGFIMSALALIILSSCNNEDPKPAAPVASFQFAIDTTNYLKVAFTNYSQNATTYAWDFGDSTGTSTDENPTYTYAKAGKYTVTLTASNASGESAVKTADVEIKDAGNFLSGKTWYLLADPAGGATYEVGPSDHSAWWWGFGVNVELCTRPCIFDNTWVFNTDGTFTYDNHGDAWGEGSAAFKDDIKDKCFDATVADNWVGANGEDLSGWNSGTHNYKLDISANTLEVTGGFIGLAKATPTGEVTTPASSITYEVLKMVDASTDTLVIQVEYPNSDSPTGTAYWLSRLVSYDNEADKVIITDCAPAPESGSPSEAAPTPTLDAADVISIYSDAYTAIDGVDTNPNWGQTTVLTGETVADDNVLKLATFNYQGIDFSGNAQDLSGMDYVHIDMWTDNATAVNAYIISGDPTVDTDFAPLAIVSGKWQGYDIPLAHFPNIDPSNVIQFKFDGGDGKVAIFLDNIYFYKGASLSGPSEAAPTPTQAAADVISIYSDAYTNIDGVNLNPDWGQGTVETLDSISGDHYIKLANFGYQGIDFGANHQDVSGMTTVHLDVWTNNASAINFSLISPGPKEKASALTIQTGQWASYDIPLSDFSDVVDLSDLFQFKFDDNAAGDAPIIYVDNIYFY